MEMSASESCFLSLSEWLAVAALIVPTLLSVVPWMMKVHAKLAVIATQIAALCEKMERALAHDEELWALFTRHAARLDAHELQISNLQDRLHELEQPSNAVSRRNERRRNPS